MLPIRLLSLMLVQHTAEVLSEVLGMNPAQIAGLVTANVISKGG